MRKQCKRTPYAVKHAAKASNQPLPFDTYLDTALLLYCHTDALLSGIYPTKDIKSDSPTIQMVMLMLQAACLASRWKQHNRFPDIAGELAHKTEVAKDAFSSSYDAALKRNWKRLVVQSNTKKQHIQEFAHCFDKAMQRATISEMFQTSNQAEELFIKHYVQVAK